LAADASEDADSADDGEEGKDGGERGSGEQRDSDGEAQAPPTLLQAPAAAAVPDLDPEGW